MAIFVIGGTGFIGIRVIPLLVAQGETVVCMDINPNAPSLAGLGDKVSVVRGDVTQFDDVISVMEASKADRVINLSYNLGQDLAPQFIRKHIRCLGNKKGGKFHRICRQLALHLFIL